jgi:penicillin-binding protein-related factor A (putative recombinase)
MSLPANAAHKGKTAESKLQKCLAKLESQRANLCFERIYDARSSLGHVSNPRVGDFAIYYNGLNVLVEVKETKLDNRLPRQNFDRAQRARLRLRSLAGTICFLVVYHSTTDKWRVLNPLLMGSEDTGSWDLKDEQSYTLEEVVKILTEVKTKEVVDAGSSQ